MHKGIWTQNTEKVLSKIAYVHSEFEIVKEYSQEFYKSSKQPHAKSEHELVGTPLCF